MHIRVQVYDTKQQRRKRRGCPHTELLICFINATFRPATVSFQYADFFSFTVLSHLSSTGSFLFSPECDFHLFFSLYLRCWYLTTQHVLTVNTWCILTTYCAENNTRSVVSGQPGKKRSAKNETTFFFLNHSLCFSSPEPSSSSGHIF